MICLIALVVFGVLGLFSAKYRSFAREAFNCVFLKMTLRKCDSGLDERLKAKSTAKLASLSPAAARLFHKNFEAVSWVFTLLMFASFALAAQGVYNYWAFGNCNGPDSSAFCVFSAFGSHSLKPPSSLEGVVMANGSPDVLVAYACFACPYSRAAWSGFRHFVASRDNLTVVFKPLPLAGHNNSFEAAAASLCADRQGKFVAFADSVFANQSLVVRYGAGALDALAGEASLDLAVYRKCYYGNETGGMVQAFQSEGIANGVYGTPTFFFNNKSAVGPLSLHNFDELAAGGVVSADAALDEQFCPPPGR